MISEWIDISVEVFNGMASWPGDPVPHISRYLDKSAGDPINLSHINISAHTGTHMDAPLHFLDNAPSMASWAPEDTVGNARIISIQNPHFITREELQQYNIQSGERILLKTRNSDKQWYKGEFNPNFVCLNPEAAEFLAQIKIRSLGIDYLSVGNEENGKEVHLHLLKAGIWIIEGLYLADLKEGDYELLCLPLKLSDADGAPARALVKSV
ncbi:MAG: cyclase family protein [Cytophagaceae bacterium]